MWNNSNSYKSFTSQSITLQENRFSHNLIEEKIENDTLLNSNSNWNMMKIISKIDQEFKTYISKKISHYSDNSHHHHKAQRSLYHFHIETKGPSLYKSRLFEKNDNTQSSDTLSVEYKLPKNSGHETNPKYNETINRYASKPKMGLDKPFYQQFNQQKASKLFTISTETVINIQNSENYVRKQTDIDFNRFVPAILSEEIDHNKQMIDAQCDPEIINEPEVRVSKSHKQIRNFFDILEKADSEGKNVSEIDKESKFKNYYKEIHNVDVQTVSIHDYINDITKNDSRFDEPAKKTTSKAHTSNLEIQIIKDTTLKKEDYLKTKNSKLKLERAGSGHLQHETTSVKDIPIEKVIRSMTKGIGHSSTEGSNNSESFLYSSDINDNYSDNINNITVHSVRPIEFENLSEETISSEFRMPTPSAFVNKVNESENLLSNSLELPLDAVRTSSNPSPNKIELNCRDLSVYSPCNVTNNARVRDDNLTSYTNTSQLQPNAQYEPSKTHVGNSPVRPGFQVLVLKKEKLEKCQTANVKHKERKLPFHKRIFKKIEEKIFTSSSCRKKKVLKGFIEPQYSYTKQEHVELMKAEFHQDWNFVERDSSHTFSDFVESLSSFTAKQENGSVSVPELKSLMSVGVAQNNLEPVARPIDIYVTHKSHVLTGDHSSSKVTSKSGSLKEISTQLTTVSKDITRNFPTNPSPIESSSKKGILHSDLSSNKHAERESYSTRDVVKMDSDKLSNERSKTLQDISFIKSNSKSSNLSDKLSTDKNSLSPNSEKMKNKIKKTEKPKLPEMSKHEINFTYNTSSSRKNPVVQKDNLPHTIEREKTTEISVNDLHNMETEVIISLTENSRPNRARSKPIGIPYEYSHIKRPPNPNYSNKAAYTPNDHTLQTELHPETRKKHKNVKVKKNSFICLPYCQYYCKSKNSSDCRTPKQQPEFQTQSYRTPTQSQFVYASAQPQQTPVVQERQSRKRSPFPKHLEPPKVKIASNTPTPIYTEIDEDRLEAEGKLDPDETYTQASYVTDDKDESAVLENVRAKIVTNPTEIGKTEDVFIHPLSSQNEIIYCDPSDQITSQEQAPVQKELAIQLTLEVQSGNITKSLQHKLELNKEDRALTKESCTDMEAQEKVKHKRSSDSKSHDSRKHRNTDEETRKGGLNELSKKSDCQPDQVRLSDKRISTERKSSSTVQKVPLECTEPIRESVKAVTSEERVSDSNKLHKSHGARKKSSKSPIAFSPTHNYLEEGFNSKEPNSNRRGSVNSADWKTYKQKPTKDSANKYSSLSIYEKAEPLLDIPEQIDDQTFDTVTPSFELNHGTDLEVDVKCKDVNLSYDGQRIVNQPGRNNKATSPGTVSNEIDKCLDTGVTDSSFGNSRDFRLYHDQLQNLHGAHGSLEDPNSRVKLSEQNEHGSNIGHCQNINIENRIQLCLDSKGWNKLVENSVTCGDEKRQIPLMVDSEDRPSRRNLQPNRQHHYLEQKRSQESSQSREYSQPREQRQQRPEASNSPDFCEIVFQKVKSAVFEYLFIIYVDNLLSCYQIRWKPFMPKHYRNPGCDDSIPIHEIMRNLAQDNKPECDKSNSNQYINFCCDICKCWVPHKDVREHTRICYQTQRELILARDKEVELQTEEADASVKPLASMPGTICYLCGRYFTRHSIRIHETACRNKWVARNENLPPRYRKSTVPRPPSLPKDLVRERFQAEQRRGNLQYKMRDAVNEMLYEESLRNQLELDP